MIEAADTPSLGSFHFGSDGSGADTLLVTKGGARNPDHAHQPRHRQRWKSDLYMDGPALINFTVAAVPELISQILADANLKHEDINLFLLHQATKKMLQQLQERLELDDERLPIALEKCGNTVSSTIPILIDELRQKA